MSLIGSIRQGLPFLKPLRIIILSFGITGYLIYKIPISGMVCPIKQSQCNKCNVIFSVTDEAKAKSGKEFVIVYCMGAPPQPCVVLAPADSRR